MMLLTALPVQTDPKAAVLHDDIFRDDRGADAREGINHKCNQSSITQTDGRAGGDTVEQLPRFIRRKDGRFALVDDVAGAANRSGGIDRHNLADHKPVEQMSDCGEARFDVRRQNSTQIDFAENN